MCKCDYLTIFRTFKYDVKDPISEAENQSKPNNFLGLAKKYLDELKSMYLSYKPT